MLFAIPYEKHFTLLGTTDVEIHSEPDQVTVTDEEVAYICKSVSRYFDRPVSPRDVVHHYAGVRPLFDDAAESASETTRDYVLHLNDDGPPILSVYGGKLTTYRKLSEQVVNMLSGPLAMDGPAWTANSLLPGGDYR